MPEIFRTLGFVFFFYSNEGQEPIHVHVRKAGGFAKFWIDPVELDFSQGMKTSDIKQAEDLIIDHIELIKTKWNEIAMIEKISIENYNLYNLAYSMRPVKIK